MPRQPLATIEGALREAGCPPFGRCVRAEILLYRQIAPNLNLLPICQRFASATGGNHDRM